MGVDARTVIQIDADNNTQPSFNRVIASVRDLAAESGRTTDDLIADSSRLSRLQIQDSQRAVNARRNQRIQEARDAAAVDLRRIRVNDQLNARQRRNETDAVRYRLALQVRAAREEAEINSQRLRNARDDITTLAAHERELHRERRQALAGVRRELAAVRRSYQRLRSVLVGFGGISLFAGIRGVVDAAVQVDTIRNSFVALGLSVRQANQELEVARRLARLPAIGFADAGRVLVQLRTINVEGQRAVALTTELANALALTGSTDLSGLVRAFTQIAGRGEVLQEEINQIVERAPILRRALTEAFGSASAEGIRMALDNAPIDEFFDRLTAAAQRSIGRAPVTGAANVFQNFRNAIRDLAAQIGALALPELTRQVRELTTYLQDNGTQIVQRFEGAVQLLVTAIDRLINNFRNLVGFLSAGLLAGTLVRATSLLSSFSAAARSGALITGTFAGAFARLIPVLARILPVLGRVTAVLAGLSGVGAAVAGAFAIIDLVRFVRGADQASDSASRLAESLDQVEQAANNAGDSLNQLTIDQILSSLALANRAFGELRSQLESVANITPQQLTLVNENDIRILQRRRAAVESEANALRERARTTDAIGENERNQLASVNQRIFALQREEQIISQILQTIRNYQSLQQQQQDIFAPVTESAGDAEDAVETVTQRIRNFALELVNAEGNIQRFRDNLRDAVTVPQLGTALNNLRRSINEAANIQLAQIDAQIAAQRAIAEATSTSVEERAEAEEELRALAADRRQVELQTQRDITDIFRQGNQRRNQILNQARTARQRLRQGRVTPDDLIDPQTPTIINSIVSSITSTYQRFIQVQQSLNQSLRRNVPLREVASPQLIFGLNLTREAVTQLGRAIVNLYRNVGVGRGQQFALLNDNLGQITNHVRAALPALRSFGQAIGRLGQSGQQGLQQLEDRLQVQRALLSNLTDAGFELAFNQEANFRNIATSFIRFSLRIIAQHFIETNLIVSNNRRVSQSYAEVAASRQAALTGGAGGLQLPGLAGLGQFATGGAGAIGVAATLFPQQFRNIGEGIGEVVSDFLSNITGQLSETGGPVPINIHFDDGTVIKQIGRGQTRNRSNRRR